MIQFVILSLSLSHDCSVNQTLTFYVKNTRAHTRTHTHVCVRMCARTR